MTFNPMMATTLMRVRKHFAPDPTVVEMGSQTLTIRVKDQPEIQTAPEFYGHLGFKRYESIDKDDTGTISADLNYPYMSAVEYDVVTNNGTGEHIFDQANLFRTIHNLCKVGGVMVHVLPWINWRNHGFYNFNPILFYDIAQDNGYEILDMFAGDRDGNIIYENIPPVEDKSPEATDKNIMLVVAMRKARSGEFSLPTQGKYREEQAAPRPPQGGLVTIFDMLEGYEFFEEPYPHLIGKLREDEFAAMSAVFPVPEDIALGRDLGNNILLQRNAAEVLADESTFIDWRRFFEAHTSTGFLQEIVRRFGPHIANAYPHLNKLPLEAGVRFRDNAPFLLDCQFATNTPVTRKRSVRGPHIDDPKQLYAGLVYMGGGELEIHRWKNKKKRKFVGRKGMKKMAECAPDSTELVSTLECEPGTVIFFLNTPDSIHGVAPRAKGEGFRSYINIIGEVAEPLFELK